MKDQLPALVEAGQLATPDGATIVPALIANAGDRAGSRYVKFFTANNRDPHTRRAHARACGSFLAWCEERGVILPAVRPFDVAAWFIAGQVVPINSPAAVRGPKYVVRTGKTPMLDAAEWRKLVDSIPTGTVRDLRDRALIATLTYSFARISAALDMKVEDPRPLITVWSEKGFCQR